MNNLPKLPKQIQKKEADFGLVFRKWVGERKNRFVNGQPFELKHTRGKNYLPFDALDSNQIAFAQSIAQSGELLRVDGKRGEPDYVFVAEPVIVVIKYPRFFCGIEMFKFLKEKNHSNKKSLSAERAKEIALFIV